MSKRKIPLKSDFRGGSSGSTNRNPHIGSGNTGSVVNRDGTTIDSVKPGSTLPYQSEGFERRWDYLNNLYHQWGNQGSGTGALGANAGNLSNAILEFLSNLKDNNYYTGTEELKAQYIQFLYQLGLINDQRTFDEYLKKDQREFDWAIKQEQRLYDNPQNELARLMGSGISRDAALQMMSGSAGGSGIGSSQVPYGSGTGISAPAPTATPGSQNLQIAQTAINGVQAFLQLVQSGVGVAEGIEQVKTLQAQNYWNSEQIQSYEAVNQITQQLSQKIADGSITDDVVSSWENLQQLQQWLVDHQQDSTISPLFQNGTYARAFGTSFGRQRMTDYYSNVIRGRNEGTQAQQFIEQQRLNNIVLGLQPEKIGAEMALIGQNMKESEQRIIESCNRVAVGEAQIQLIDKQGNFIDIQGKQLVRKTDAEIDLMGSQSYLADVQGKQAAQIFEYNSAGFPMLKQAYIHECRDKLAYWSTIDNPKVKKERILTWLYENENAHKAAYLKQIQLEAVGSFASDYPDLWELSQGFQYAGVNDFIRTGVEAGGTAATSGTAIYKALKYLPK